MFFIGKMNFLLFLCVFHDWKEPDVLAMNTV